MMHNRVCEDCYIYKERLADLKELAKMNFNKNRKKVKAFLKQLDPLIREFVPEDDRQFPVALRTENSIKKIALKFLKANHSNGESVPYERKLKTVLSEIYSFN